MRCGNLAVPTRPSASPSSAAFTADLLNPSLWINSLPRVLKPPGGAPHRPFTAVGSLMHLSPCIQLVPSLYSSPPLTLDLTSSSMNPALLCLGSLSDPTTTRCPSRSLLIPTRLSWMGETVHQTSLHLKQTQGKRHHQTESSHRSTTRLECRRPQKPATIPWLNCSLSLLTSMMTGLVSLMCLCLFVLCKSNTFAHVVLNTDHNPQAWCSLVLAKVACQPCCLLVHTTSPSR